MSKRKSVLGSEGGTCYKDGPVPQVQCLVLKGGWLQDVGESVPGEGELGFLKDFGGCSVR